MKHLLITLIICTTAVFSTAQEVSQCDIAIDKKNTKVYKNRNNQFVLKTVVRHKPPFGNDDDAHGVVINIQIPNNTEYADHARVFINGNSVGEVSYSGHTITISGIHLTRPEHIDIEVFTSNPCVQEGETFQYVITAIPTAPYDIDITNNQFLYERKCMDYHLSN